jgi:hypothetical protein
VSDELNRKFEEIAESFGQRAAETVLDLSHFDYEKCFRNEELHLLAVALRAMETGYGWEFDGNLEFVYEWKIENDCPVVQIQPNVRWACT